MPTRLSDQKPTYPNWFPSRPGGLKGKRSLLADNRSEFADFATLPQSLSHRLRRTSRTETSTGYTALTAALLVRIATLY